MKPKHSIEEYFRAEFSDWSPNVPPRVKKSLDKAIVAPKRKRSFWLWIFVPLVYLCLGPLISYYATFSHDEVKNRTEKSSVARQKCVQDDKNALNTSQSSIQQNKNNLTSNTSVHQDDRISLSHDQLSHDHFNNSEHNSVSRKTKYLDSYLSAPVRNVLSSLSIDNNSNQNQEVVLVNASSNSTQLSTESEPSSIVLDTSFQNVSQPSTNTVVVDLPDSNLAFSKFIIGGSFSIMQGKNSWADPTIQITEKLSYNGVLELGYKANKSFALVSGFNFQARNENYQTQNIEVDSIASVVIQYIYEPNIPFPVDSITIVIFNLDTTFTSIQQRGSWRHFGLPLFVDWTMYEKQTYSFGLQAGTVLGLASFKSFDDSNNPIEQWSKFSNQWLIKPNFYYHMGPWRYGAQLSLQYDLVLPQAWALQNYKRYAYGLAFSIRYQLPSR